MPYQVMSSFIARVTVCCESCGHEFAYEKAFKAYGSHNDQTMAAQMANVNRDVTYDWQAKRLAEGNYASIALNIPCPRCRYMQSWMVEPLRQRNGWQWGAILAFFTFLLAIPVAFVAEAFLRKSVLASAVAIILVLLVFVLPLIVLFAARALVMKNFNANKSQPASARRNTPSVALHKD